MSNNAVDDRYREWIAKQSKRFSAIGATFAIDSNGNIYEPENGISVSDGVIQWIVKLDATLAQQLIAIFEDIAVIADLNRTVLQSEHERIYGVWLDLESNPVSYFIESGRLFHDIDKAFDYADQYGQRYIYNLTTHDTIAVIGNVIDSNTGDDFLIDLEKVQ